MAEPITMYTTRWCGHCRRLKRQLDDAGISVALVDIDLDENARHGARIEARTGGYRVVPTVEIDGALLVNPTLEQVRAALGGLSDN
jgi:mycoredoxin